MAKDPFLLVSLEESESKNLAQVMSNDTARKILDYLSKNESATESQIAKELKLALSTVHYNLQALVKATLVQAEEFHYSQKGKEVLHYSLANKLIIIAPKRASAESFKDKLKGLLPVGLISLGAAGIIQLFNMFNSGFIFGASKLGGVAANYVPESVPLAAEGARMAVQEVVQDVAPAAAPVAMKLAVDAGVNATVEAAADASLMAASVAPEAARSAADVVQQAPPVIVQVVQSSPDFLALWFLAGSLFALILVAAWYYFSSKGK